ncbi:ribosomal L27e protein family-domain-containing protein [Syncephalis plumigaleata]|nr:ribosomal L27e protein family-domain-containing protein [Syncephalis plumigaleata]
MKFLKPGKVAIVLNGRYAGRKVVIVKNYDEGTKDRAYGHALVVGIDRYPRRITADMSRKKVTKRAHMKPFIKAINYNHLMPTRYTLELEQLKQIVNPEAIRDPSQRIAAKKKVRAALTQRFHSGKNKWFFVKLRF